MTRHKELPRIDRRPPDGCGRQFTGNYGKMNRNDWDFLRGDPPSDEEMRVRHAMVTKIIRDAKKKVTL